MPDSILDAIDGALADYQTSKDAMRWTPPEEQKPRLEIPAGEVILTSEAFNEQVAEMGRYLTRLGQQMMESFSSAFKPFRKLNATLVKIAHLREPGSHGHCRTCHPEQAPRPLAVNGHDYRRRQRARQRRKR